MKKYTDLVKINNFRDRLEYLKLNQEMFYPTFGAERYLNQNFYNSKKWRRVRDGIILRDGGYDLGNGPVIHGSIIVHHINPITAEDIYEMNPLIYDEDNLISCSRYIHDLITFGKREPIIHDRKEGDTILW